MEASCCLCTERRNLPKAFSLVVTACAEATTDACNNRRRISTLDNLGHPMDLVGRCKNSPSSSRPSPQTQPQSLPSPPILPPLPFSSRVQPLAHRLHARRLCPLLDRLPLERRGTDPLPPLPLAHGTSSSATLNRTRCRRPFPDWLSHLAAAQEPWHSKSQDEGWRHPFVPLLAGVIEGGADCDLWTLAHDPIAHPGSSVASQVSRPGQLHLLQFKTVSNSVITLQ
jgi:hypothetical protein